MAPQQMAFVDELKDLNEHSGKQFYASDRLVPDWESPRFPSLSTESLASSAETIQLPEHFKGEVTLVALSYKDIGAQALPSWIEPFMSSVGSYGSGAGGGRARRDGRRAGGAQLVQLTIAESSLYRVFRGSLVSSLRRLVDISRHHSYLVHVGGGGAVRDLRAALEIKNRLVGYVFLVDSDARVRWRGCGEATTEEIDRMIECAQGLCAARDAGHGVRQHESYI